MTAAAPRVSVVIPTRQRLASLASCLERLAPGTQTLDRTRYEVVVSDDGDTGDTRALLERSFPWARYCAGPRRGPASNRNAGVRASRGEWIAFTDDDTLPDPDWLEQLLAASAGVRAVEGEFERGDPVIVRGPDGTQLARGLSAYASSDAERIAGHRSDEIEAILGWRGRDEVVHRDDLVLL